MKTPKTVKYRCLTTTTKKYWDEKSIKIGNTFLFKGFDNLIDPFEKYLTLLEHELPIIGYFKNENYWNMTTTHRIISKYEDKFQAIQVNNIKELHSTILEKDMKGIKRKETEIIYLLKDKKEFVLKISAGTEAFALMNCIHDLVWMFNANKISYL